MSLNIGCLVRKFDWKSKWRSSNPVQWVEQQGFTAVSAPLTEAYPDYFQDANQMVVFSQKDQEIWLGYGYFTSSIKCANLTVLLDLALVW